MKKEWLLAVFVVGLAAILNGCCSKCPSCTLPSDQAGTGAYQSGQAQAQGSYSGSRSVK